MKGFFLALILALLSATVLTADAPELSVVRGPITAVEGEPLVITTEDGSRLELVVEEPDAFHTFHDPELAGRTWELEGVPLDGDRFEVRKLFTIKDGKRYQVTYYCEICHITSYRPGRCMCCQEEVELREVPADQ